MSSRPRVFATRSLPGRALERLAERVTLDVWPRPEPPARDALVERSASCEGLLCMLSDPIDRATLSMCPLLRVISSFSVGVDHIDLDAARQRGIQVGHTPGVLTETTADLAFALLLAAGRRLGEAERFVREGRWSPGRRWEPDLLLGRDLHGATLGVVGLGAIGRAVARRAAGFGMQVLGWNRTPRPLPGVSAVSLDALLSRSDFVSIHLALTAETRGSIGAPELARMKPGAVLVNTARGGLVDEAALAAALASGALGAAGLDVFDEEPLAPGSPLLALPNAVLLPHIGSASVATREAMAELAVDNLLAGLEGRALPHPVAGPGADGAD